MIQVGERALCAECFERLAKALMVSRLQVLLQSKRIHLLKTPDSQALVDELLNYEIRVSENAQDTYGAFRTGKHDDLATALGLACFVEDQGGGAVMTIWGPGGIVEVS